jgi:hypothetical protein
MGEVTDSFVELVKRYPWALIQIAVCVLVLFIMLLVFEDIPSSWHDHIASLTIYTVGVALLTQIRLEITVYANTKAKSANQAPQGMSTTSFGIIIGLYALWFLLLVAYNIYRGILSFT